MHLHVWSHGNIWKAELQCFRECNCWETLLKIHITELQYYYLFPGRCWNQKCSWKIKRMCYVYLQTCDLGLFSHCTFKSCICKWTLVPIIEEALKYLGGFGGKVCSVNVTVCLFNAPNAFKRMKEGKIPVFHDMAIFTNSSSKSLAKEEF